MPEPPASLQSDNSEVPKKENNSTSEANAYMNIPPENASVSTKAESNFIETDTRLTIPRSMRRHGSSNLPLGDRNASKSDESISKKEPEVDARSPVRQKRTLEKENNGL